jgi:IMP and pyridine-specific 5'-nucleotidase
MSSNYRTNYHLRSHKRDGFIEFIKSLLLTPFVLHSRSPASLSGSDSSMNDSADTNLERFWYLILLSFTFSEIMSCIENLIEDHRTQAEKGLPGKSRLSQLYF